MPDNDIGWGQGAVNNDIGWGKGASNNSINWGAIHADSPSGDTDLVGASASPSFTNTKSLSLDGVNDSATAGHSGWGTSFTWSVWINISSVSNYMGIYSDGSTVVPYLSGFNNGTTTKIAYGHSNGELQSTTSITTGNWTHVVLRKTSGTINIFINGQLDNSTVNDTGNYGVSSAVIGNFTPFVGSGFGLHGKIDELALFNSALSDPDIASIWNNGTPTDVSSLNPVNYWRFEDNGNDLGSGGNTATLNNGATFSTDVPS
jgi:hypothetical protein